MRSSRAVVLRVVGARGEVRRKLGHGEAEHEPLALALGRDDGAAGLRVLGHRAGLGLVLGELGLLDEREGAEGARRAGEEVDVVVGRHEVGRLRQSRERAQAHAEDVGGRRRGRVDHPPATGEGDLAAQRVDAEGGDLAAVAHVAAQALEEAARQPAHVGGQDDAAVVLQARAAVARERDVGGDVVAVVAAVEPGEQRRVALREAGREPVAGVDAEELGADAAVEHVGQAVAVVVERVVPLPGHDGQDDEDAVAPGALDREGNRRGARGRAHLQQVDPGLAPGAWRRTRADVLRRLGVADGDPTRRTDHVHGLRRASTKNSTSSPARVATFGGRTPR